MEYHGTFLEHFARQPAHIQAKYVGALLALMRLRRDVSPAAQERIAAASAAAGAIDAQFAYEETDEPRVAA
jgi:hypothetical protein